MANRECLSRRRKGNLQRTASVEEPYGDTGMRACADDDMAQGSGVPGCDQEGRRT